jgi:3D (Asp-Asp-Asp) domain-containing protein
MRYIYRLCLWLGCAGLFAFMASASTARAAAPVSSKAGNPHTPGFLPGPVAQTPQTPASRVTPASEVVIASSAETGKPLPSASANAGHSARQSNVCTIGVVEVKPVSRADSPNNAAPAAPGEDAPSDLDNSRAVAGRSLARVTAYWACEGDYYTRHHLSATGIRLHDGLCAVDPSIIPYGSMVEIAGVGKYLAVDTGSAVVSRTAAREGGHTFAERHALVIDLYFEDRDAGERFAAAEAKYVAITWWAPTAAYVQGKVRSLIADQDWSRLEGKQL